MFKNSILWISPIYWTRCVEVPVHGSWTSSCSCVWSSSTVVSFCKIEWKKVFFLRLKSSRVFRKMTHLQAAQGLCCGAGFLHRWRFLLHIRRIVTLAVRWWWRLGFVFFCERWECCFLSLYVQKTLHYTCEHPSLEQGWENYGLPPHLVRPAEEMS